MESTITNDQLSGCRDVLLAFCRNESFFTSVDQKSNRIDALKAFAIETKRESSELIFIDSPDDVLKEAVALLKKCADDSTDALFAFIDASTEESDRNTIYKLSLLKAIMQTTKLGTGSTEEEITERKDLIARFDRIVNDCLKASREKVNPEEGWTMQLKSIESLGLLMMLDVAKFDKYIDIFIKAIDNERAELHKSKSLGIMLQAIFDALRVHSYMKLQRLPTEPNEPDAQERFNQRKLRLR